MDIMEIKNRLRSICDKQDVVRLDLFGSRARSQGSFGKDYDFVVEFSNITPGEYSKRYFGLLHALEDELDSPIDLLTYSSIRRNSLRKKIAEEKVPLYERWNQRITGGYSHGGAINKDLHWQLIRWNRTYLTRKRVSLLRDALRSLVRLLPESANWMPMSWSLYVVIATSNPSETSLFTLTITSMTELFGASSKTISTNWSKTYEIQNKIGVNARSPETRIDEWEY